MQRRGKQTKTNAKQRKVKQKTKGNKVTQCNAQTSKLKQCKAKTRKVNNKQRKQSNTMQREGKHIKTMQNKEIPFCVFCWGRLLNKQKSPEAAGDTS